MPHVLVCSAAKTHSAGLLYSAASQMPTQFVVGSRESGGIPKRRYTNLHRHFWHHCMRKAFTSHAVALCTRVLRLPKHSQLTRYLILIITFMISAIMHMFAAPELERCSIYPQFRYYGSIIAAITLEDVVIKGNRRFWRSRTSSDLSKQNGKPKGAATAYPLRQQQDEEKPALFWRLIGYIWVFGFHIWAGSKLIYGLWSHCST